MQAILLLTRRQFEAVWSSNRFYLELQRIVLLPKVAEPRPGLVEFAGGAHFGPLMPPSVGRLPVLAS